MAIREVSTRFLLPHRLGSYFAGVQTMSCMSTNYFEFATCTSSRSTDYAQVVSQVVAVGDRDSLAGSPASSSVPPIVNALVARISFAALRATHTLTPMSSMRERGTLFETSQGHHAIVAHTVSAKPCLEPIANTAALMISTPVYRVLRVRSFFADSIGRARSVNQWSGAGRGCEPSVNVSAFMIPSPRPRVPSVRNLLEIVIGHARKAAHDLIARHDLDPLRRAAGHPVNDSQNCSAGCPATLSANALATGMLPPVQSEPGIRTFFIARGPTFPSHPPETCPCAMNLFSSVFATQCMSSREAMQHARTYFLARATVVRLSSTPLVSTGQDPLSPSIVASIVSPTIDKTPPAWRILFASAPARSQLPTLVKVLRARLLFADLDAISKAFSRATAHQISEPFVSEPWAHARKPSILSFPAPPTIDFRARSTPAKSSPTVLMSARAEPSSSDAEAKHLLPSKTRMPSHLTNLLRARLTMPLESPKSGLLVRANPLHRIDAIGALPPSALARHALKPLSSGLASCRSFSSKRAPAHSISSMRRGHSTFANHTENAAAHGSCFARSRPFHTRHPYEKC